MPYKSFHVPKSVIVSIHNRARKTVWVVALTPIIVILFLYYTKGDHNTSSLLTALLPGVGLAVFIAWRYSRRIQKWVQNMSRYEVRVEAGISVSSSNPIGSSSTDAAVLEDALGLNWLTLKKDEIGSIVYFEGQRIIITSKDESTIIPLGTKLSPFDELLDSLETLGPVERKTGNQFILIKAISEYVPVIGLITALIATDPKLKLLGGLVAMIGYGYQLVVLNRIYTEIKNRKKVLLKVVLFAASLFLIWAGLRRLF